MQGMDYKSGSKFVVFGTGLEAVKCIYYWQNRGIEIAYCLNNNCKEEQFCGYPVYEPDQQNLQSVFIFVASKVQVYPVISKQLRENGRVEFKDYIFYEWAYKKLVLLHGNCHMAIVSSFLLSSELFSGRFSIYPNPPICENKEGKIDKAVLENCDVWIHEDIRSDNEFGYYLSDEYMRPLFRTDVIEITIPHLFGLGKAFFPQSEWNHRNKKIKNGEDANGMFPHADKVIDQCVKQGMRKADIINYCMSDVAIDRDEIENNFKLYIDKMRTREQKWDIKIVDYILENYRARKLFYDMGHPVNEILEVISSVILEKLGITDKSITAYESLDVHEEPVYPVVRKVLKMDWSDGLLRKSIAGKKAGGEMNFEEYIKEYLWWCYGIK